MKFQDPLHFPSKQETSIQCWFNVGPLFLKQQRSGRRLIFAGQVKNIDEIPIWLIDEILILLTKQMTITADCLVEPVLSTVAYTRSYLIARRT